MAGAPVLKLPPKELRLFAGVLGSLAQGKAVAAMPKELDISTQEAAMYLNVSRSYFVKLLEKNRPDLKDQVPRTAELMNKAIEDCLIQGYILPDPDDRHVLTAAIAGHADAIVAFNLKDFPSSAVEVHGIEVLHPDDFLVAQY